MMGDKWLEKELARQLAPVAAPQSLWDRINGGPQAHEPQAQRIRPRRRAMVQAILWPAAAALLVTALGVAYLNRGSRENRFTEQELALLATHPGFDFQSDNFGDARRWVKTRANIDIEVPQRYPAANNGLIHVVGVRLAKLHGLPIAAVDYKVGDEVATLVVSGRRAGLTGDDMGPSLHLHSRRGLTYWNMRNETYTIAFQSVKNPHGACMLCHATAPGQGS